MKKQLAPDLSALISTAAAAQLLMVTPTWLRRLERDGWFAKAERGQYRLTDLVQGFIRYLRDEDRRATKTARFAKVQDARAEEIQLRLDEKRRVLQLAARDEAIALVDAVIGPLRSDLQSIPARVTKDLELRRRIEGELNAVLDSAADRAADYRGGEGAGGAPRRKGRR